MDAEAERILRGNPDFRTGPERAGISIEPKAPKPIGELRHNKYDTAAALEVFESLLLLTAGVPLTEDLNKHPLVLVQAVKGLVGLRPEKPSQRLMEFALKVCEEFEYIPPVRSLLQVGDDELGEIISVHGLEQAVLAGDLAEAQKQARRLITVSDNKAMLFDVLLDVAARSPGTVVKAVPFVHSAQRAMEFTGSLNLADFLLPALEAVTRGGIGVAGDISDGESMTVWESLPWLSKAPQAVITLAAHIAQIEADEHVKGASIRDGLERSLAVLVEPPERAEESEIKGQSGSAADLLDAVQNGKHDKARGVGRFLGEQGERVWLLEVLEGVGEERCTYELVLWADAFRMLLKAATIQHSGLLGEMAGNILIREAVIP